MKLDSDELLQIYSHHFEDCRLTSDSLQTNQVKLHFGHKASFSSIILSLDSHAISSPDLTFNDDGTLHLTQTSLQTFSSTIKAVV